MAKTPVTVVEDRANDVVIVEGIRFSGELFRLWKTEMPVGTIFKLVKRENWGDGTTTIWVEKIK